MENMEITENPIITNRKPSKKSKNKNFAVE